MDNTKVRQIAWIAVVLMMLSIAASACASWSNDTRGDDNPNANAPESDTPAGSRQDDAPGEAADDNDADDNRDDDDSSASGRDNDRILAV
jgi:hypothetical protein